MRGGFDDLATGRHEVDGEHMHIMVNRYSTRESAELPYEAHRTYLDVHYIVSGREILYWEDLEAMLPGEGYDTDSDAETYGDSYSSCR